jgi:hypothetical protein
MFVTAIRRDATRKASVPGSISPPLAAANGRVLGSVPPRQHGQVSVRGTATFDPSTTPLSTARIVRGSTAGSYGDTATTTWHHARWKSWTRRTTVATLPLDSRGRYPVKTPLDNGACVGGAHHSWQRACRDQHHHLWRQRTGECQAPRHPGSVAKLVFEGGQS